MTSDLNFTFGHRPIYTCGEAATSPVEPIDLLNLFRAQSNGDTPRRLNLTPTTFVLYLYTRKYLWYRKTSKNKQRN